MKHDANNPLTKDKITLGDSMLNENLSFIKHDPNEKGSSLNYIIAKLMMTLHPFFLSIRETPVHRVIKFIFIKGLPEVGAYCF